MEINNRINKINRQVPHVSHIGKNRVLGVNLVNPDLTNKKFAKPTQEIEVGTIRIHMNTGVNTRAYCNECLPKNKIVNPDKLQKTFFWGSLLKSIYSNEQRDIRNGFGVSSRGFALFPIRR